MLRRTDPERQGHMEMVYLEQLVRPDHLLRKMQKYTDFSFILEKVKDQYSPDNGRPSLDPIVLFKMLFIGHLFGIRSERRLVQEIADNLAHRWFLGLGLNHPIPSASTIRARRWKDGKLCQEIFDAIVLQCIQRDLVDGTILFSDATEMKAKANGNKFTVKQVEESTRGYIENLNHTVEEDRRDHGKPALRGVPDGLDLRVVDGAAYLRGHRPPSVTAQPTMRDTGSTRRIPLCVPSACSFHTAPGQGPSRRRLPATCGRSAALPMPRNCTGCGMPGCTVDNNGLYRLTLRGTCHIHPLRLYYAVTGSKKTAPQRR